jgi:AsmA family protein
LNIFRATIPQGGNAQNLDMFPNFAGTSLAARAFSHQDTFRSEMTPDTMEPRTGLESVLQRARGSLARAGNWARRSLAQTTWSWVRVFRWSAITLVVLLVGGFLWLYFLDWNTMRGPVARYASHRLGREVRIEGNLQVHLFSFTPRISVSGLEVVNPTWVGQRLAADVDHLTVTFRLLPLLRGRLLLPFVEIDNPKILIMRDAQRNTNWDFGNSNRGWKIPPINRFIVQNGQVNIDDRLRKMMFAGTVSSQEYANGGASAFELTGSGTLNGKKFTAEVHGGPLVNVDETRPYRFTADIHSGETHVAADGEISKPFHLGQFSAETTFSGPTLSDLYYLTGLAFPGTPRYQLSGMLVRDGTVYRFTKFTGIVGDTDLHGDLAVETSHASPFVRATLKSHKLSFDDLGPLFGVPPSGTNAARSEYLLPDTPLHIERIRQMDAEVQYDADSIKSRDFPLRALHVHVVLGNGIMKLNPIAFDFTRGKLTGSVNLDARKDVPETDVDARLSDIRLEQFVGGTPPPIEGVLAAHAQLHGSGNSVHKVASTASGAVTLVVPAGKFRKSFAELTGIDLLNGLGLLLANDKSDTGLRCAVVHFDAHGGILNAQQFVMDTDQVLIQGSGRIDLGNETLNMSISGKPKEFRLGRVRAPITISGSLSHPAIGVNAGSAAAQGGIAVALGFLSPIAALLPFVDPGLAKDADCVALSGQAANVQAPVRKPSHKVVGSLKHR